MSSRGHPWGQTAKRNEDKLLTRGPVWTRQPASMLGQTTDLIRIHKDEIRKRKKK